MSAKKYLVILLALIFFTQEHLVYAEEDQSPQISAAIAPVIGSASLLLEAGYYEEALSDLEEALQNPNLTTYEKALIYQLKGQSHYGRDQRLETIHAFEAAIHTGGLSNNEVQQLHLYVAQIWIGMGNYQYGAELLVKWGQAGNALTHIHSQMIMNAYIQSEDYELALPWAERWFHDASPKARKHYDLMNFLYNNLGQNEKQIEIVKAMTERWPDDKVLSDSLASIYANNGQEREAFEVTRNII